MFDINNLTITIGNGRKIVENLSFSLQNSDKLAIIGEEGNGKSTLVKAIVNKDLISSYANVQGAINTYGQTIGYLEQLLPSEWNEQEIYNFFLKDGPEDEDNFERFNDIGTFVKYIASFGLNQELLSSDQKIGTLSGGEKVKIQLIKILARNPDILIFDEPTNDIDLKTLEWMEQFIKTTTKPIIFISHDEELLENTANAILHLEQLKKKTECKHTFVRMGYADYVKQRLHNLEKQSQVALKEKANYEAQMERWRQINSKVDSQLSTISRKDPHGGRLLKKKMQSVKAQQKRFERERDNLTEVPDAEEAIYINFNGCIMPNGKFVCDLNIDSLVVKDRELAKNLSLKIVGPQKVVIVGNNGVGKTTFIRHIVSLLKSRKDINVGYMPQNYDEDFVAYKSAWDYVSRNTFKKEDLTRVRTFLGTLKFTNEEVEGGIDELSGGQKAKLYIAKLMEEGCSVLILDEPTRNLSPLSNPEIRRALKLFPGAIISVSHDRKFIKEVATKVYKMTSEGLKCVDN